MHNAPLDNCSPNHKAIAQLRQLWNGDHRSGVGPPVRPEGDDAYWAVGGGLLSGEEDDGDYVPDARDDESTARTISGLTPLEM